jgi:Tol biopolymer transport system component
MRRRPQKPMVVRMNRLFMIAPAFFAACTAAVVEDRARPESDERPLSAFTVDGTRIEGRAALTLDDGRVLVVDNNDALRFAHARTPLLDRVRAVVDAGEGRVVASRSTDVGESDLWLVRLDGSSPPRAIAAEKGADEMPLALDDGRVLFASTRSGRASLWIAALDGSGLRQLTGAPPPVSYVSVDGTKVTYDAGDGDVRTVDVGAR